MALFIAPASTAQTIFAPEFSMLLHKLVGRYAFMITHFVIHILPLVLLVTCTYIPRPIYVGVTSAITIALGCIYMLTLGSYWRSNPLSNYFIPRRARTRVLFVWTACFIVATLGAELLFQSYGDERLMMQR
jgi:hypothetical protein